MNYGLIFFKFLPLFLYIGVDYWKGFRAGILAAIAASIFMCVFDYMTNGFVDQFSLGESFLIIVLGITSLKMNNDRFFKYQPTVVAFLCAAVFICFELKQKSFLVEYSPHIEKMFFSEAPSLSARSHSPKTPAAELSPEAQAFLDNLHSPKTQHSFVILSRLLILVFVGHGLIMAYAARHWSTPKWFAWRLAVYPAFVVAMMASMIMA